MSDAELDELLAEAHSVVNDRSVARVSRTLEVLPRMLTALDRVVLYRRELSDTRIELTQAVRRMREAVWALQKSDPGITLGAAHIEREVHVIRRLLDRIDRLLHTPET